MKKISICCLVLIALAALSGCGPKSDVTTLKLGHGLDITHPVHVAMVSMAKSLEEKSGGKIKMDIYPNEQLGSEREMAEQVQLGSIDMVKISASVLESFMPSMSVFSIPYIIRDSEHQWKVLRGPIGKEILASGESKGLKGLCYYDAGSRSFYTKDKPILSPADLVGMKIRVQQSKTAMDTVKALGASPTPIAWGELYTSLQQGMVDGAENNPPSFYTSAHYEVCKHYSLDEHSSVPDVLLISFETWNHLSEEGQKMLQDAADESSVFQQELWKEKTKESIEAVKKAGVTVHYPDKAPFMESVREMHNSYDDSEIGDFIKEIQAVD